MTEHGSTTMYNQGCRCEPCRAARGDYETQRRLGLKVDPEALRAILDDLFPFGLTADCPRARGTQNARTVAGARVLR